MITRVFKVLIKEEYLSEFENDYHRVSVPYVKSQKGCISVATSKPMYTDNLEYIMISNWEGIEFIKEFVGENWEEPFIPQSMKKYVKDCWVNHYHN